MPDANKLVSLYKGYRDLKKTTKQDFTQITNISHFSISVKTRHRLEKI